MRNNLLSLQQTARLQDLTQNRLATGLKVNSAIDNPSSYYTAQSLNNRAEDLNLLLDAMSQGIQTLKAVNESIEAGTKFLEQAKSVANAALEMIDNSAEIYDGESNTQAIVNQIGAQGLVATAANQFYAPGVSKNDATFGQGTWYLPSIGELMDMYGTNVDNMTAGNGTSGAEGDNKAAVNNTLTALIGKGVEAEVFLNGYHWSSSECNYNGSWDLSMYDGNRGNNYKYSSNRYVRCFQLLENCFYPFNSSGVSGTGSGEAAPKIGDVMYSDLSYGSADDYDGRKTAVGVVTWVSEDSGSAKIVNLKNLKFSSYDQAGNFDPDNPYVGSATVTRWTTDSDAKTTDIKDATNYNYQQLLAAAQSGGTVTVRNTNLDVNDINLMLGAQVAQYNEILSQYDALINDGTYKGVNLLKSQNLRVNFNEDRSSGLDIAGQDASSQALGLVSAEWTNLNDIAKSLAEISGALTSIRQMSNDFGNCYGILSTRNSFTENLINILSEGADQLTLADMNQESANMLALQTRQQLAVNSLSLASQASQSVLKLF